jgi:outer membrane protein
MIGHTRIWTGLVAAVLAAPIAQGADLLQVYERAAQNDPLIREAEANRLAALESKPRALGALLPQIDANGILAQRDSSGSQTFLTQVLNQPAQINTTDQETDAEFTQYQLQLTQTVFRWDQWVTLKQANSQVAQAEANYAAAQQDLMLRSAQRYFDVLAAEDTLQSVTTARDAIARQLEQAEKRFEVGLIAITDVQEAKAAYDNATATLIQAKRNLATSHELLRELTGDPFHSLSKLSESMPLKSPDPQDEDQWVKTAMEQNIALTASRLAAEIARDTISIRRSGHFPTLDLVLSRTGYEADVTQINDGVEGPADSDNVEDQVSLQLNFPIYSGGRTQSNVREAVYLHRAARERLERTARETERETRDAYLGVLSEMSRVQALKQALESSRTALQATEAGYEVGTRTTVDVLDARRRLAEAETNYARSRYDYLINVVRLKLAAGILKPDDIANINQWLAASAPAQPAPPAQPRS